MKASELWAFCDRHKIDYFSKDNRAYRKTRLAMLPIRNSDGVIYFATKDTLFGNTKKQTHVIWVDGYVIHHRMKTWGYDEEATACRYDWQD
jgi:hypothetical protein